MDDPLPSLIGAICVALLGSIFAGAETALNTISSARLSALIEQTKGWRNRVYQRIQQSEHGMRSRYLLGRVLCAAMTAVLLMPHFEGTYAPLYAVLSATLMLGTVSELTSTLARKHADTAAAYLPMALRPADLLLAPLWLPLGWLGELVGRPKLGARESDPRLAEAEVEYMLDEAELRGAVDSEEAEMIRNALDFGDHTARNVMVPRAQVKAVRADTPLAEVREVVAATGHSRYPVYEDETDNIVGLLYAKDVFKIGAAEDMKLAAITRKPVTFVPESQPLPTLLKEMRGRRQHMFMVVDEFGTFSGIVTLEDVLEEIVGDIQDEHDEAEIAPIQDLGDGRLVADAAVSIGDLSDYLGAEIPEDDDYASLGGMLTHHAGQVPQIGTALSLFGLRFIVRDSDEAKVAKVEIVRLPTEEVA